MRVYRAAVIGLFLYLTLNTLVLFVYQDVKHLDTALERMLASGDPIGLLLGDRSLFATVRFRDYFVWQLPGLLLAAGVMAARLRKPFLGPAGYLRSCLTGQVAWPAGFFGIFGIFVALVYVMR